LPHLRTFIEEQPGTKTFGSDRKWKSQIRIRRERHQVTIKETKLEAAKLGLLGSTEITTPEMPPLPLKDARSYCCCTQI
jgi:hypothetical protein